MHDLFGLIACLIKRCLYLPPAYEDVLVLYAVNSRAKIRQVVRIFVSRRQIDFFFSTFCSFSLELNSWI